MSAAVLASYDSSKSPSLQRRTAARMSANRVSRERVLTSVARWRGGVRVRAGSIKRSYPTDYRCVTVHLNSDQMEWRLPMQRQDELDLTGKVVIITGASRGI